MILKSSQFKIKIRDRETNIIFGIRIKFLFNRFGIEFLELELNYYSNCEFRGKKMCLEVEFFRLKNIIF
jgi:hypothetical protein